MFQGEKILSDLLQAIIFGFGVVFVFILGFIAGTIESTFLYEYKNDKKDSTV